jgi:hypothetical protein
VHERSARESTQRLSSRRDPFECRNIKPVRHNNNRHCSGAYPKIHTHPHHTPPLPNESTAAHSLGERLLVVVQAFKPDRKLNVAAPHHVLNLKIFESHFKSQFLNNTGVSMRWDGQDGGSRNASMQVTAHGENNTIRGRPLPRHANTITPETKECTSHTFVRMVFMT